MAVREATFIALLSLTIIMHSPKEQSRKPTRSTPTKATGRPSQDTSPLASKMAKLSVAEPVEKPQSPPIPKQTFDHLITKKAELYLWDQDDGHFLKQADIYGSISQASKSGYNYLISAMTFEGQQLLAHKLTTDLNARWSQSLASLTWNYAGDSGIISSWCFKFDSFEDFTEFQQVYGSCMYEALNQTSWEKVKVMIFILYVKERAYTHEFSVR